MNKKHPFHQDPRTVITLLSLSVNSYKILLIEFSGFYNEQLGFIVKNLRELSRVPISSPVASKPGKSVFKR